MKPTVTRFVLILIIVIPIQVRSQSIIQFTEPVDYWPTEDWQTSTPDEHGVNGTLLEIMNDYIYEEDLWLDSVVVITILFTTAMAALTIMLIRNRRRGEMQL